MKVSRPRITASHQLGLALLVSACAHVVFLTLALAQPEAGRSALSHRQGVLTVLSIGHSRLPAARPVPPPPPALPLAKAAPSVKAPQAQTPIEHRAPPAPVSEPTEAQAPPGDVPVAAPASMQAPPGSPFTSLFAPILSQPLGRGRWGSPPRPMPPPDPQQVRQQVILAMVTDLRQRLAGLPSARCDIQLDVDSREGSVDCDTHEDSAQVWAVLQGLLRPGRASPDGMGTLCLSLGAGQTLVQTCRVDTNRTTP